MARRTHDPYPNVTLVADPPARAFAPAERWQHGSAPVEQHGRQRVERPVDVLRARGSIGDAEVVAANRYYEDWAFGVHGAEIEHRGGSGGGVDGYSIAQIEALGRVQDVHRAFNLRQYELLQAIVIDERSIRTHAKGAGQKDATSRARVRLAAEVVAMLVALADFYATLDSARPAKRPCKKRAPAM